MTGKDIYTVRIKARGRKADLEVTVNRGGMGKKVEDDQIEISCATEEIQIGDEKSAPDIKIEIVEQFDKEILAESDVVILRESSKISVIFRQPNAKIVRMVTDELNEIPEVKGISSWSPTQDSSMICVLGAIRKKHIENTIQSKVVEIMVEYLGGEKE